MKRERKRFNDDYKNFNKKEGRKDESDSYQKTAGTFTGTGHGLQPAAYICAGNRRRCASSF